MRSTRCGSPSPRRRRRTPSSSPPTACASRSWMTWPPPPRSRRSLMTWPPLPGRRRPPTTRCGRSWLPWTIRAATTRPWSLQSGPDRLPPPGPDLRRSRGRTAGRSRGLTAGRSRRAGYWRVEPQVVRYSERPELWDAISGLTDEVWPEYNTHGVTLNHYWDQLYDVFPEGLAPVHIDRERDAGEYWEPNIWIIHDARGGAY